MRYELSNGQLVSQDAGQEKLCSTGSMETELPGETPGAGFLQAITETSPSVATTDSSFCGKSHPLSRKSDTSLPWPSCYTSGSLISMQCCSWQHIHIFVFHAVTLSLSEFRRATDFLTSVSPLIVFKISCHVFFSLAVHHSSLPLALRIVIVHPTCCTS